MRRIVSGICILCITCLCAGFRDEKPKMSPLMKAVSTGNSFRVQKLIAQGADVLEVDPQTHETLLMKQEALQNPEILRMLLGKDSSNINAQTNDGWTALIYAILLSAPPESIELLLRYGANANDVIDQKDTSVLHLAAWQGDEKIVNALLNASADINIQDSDMLTPLMVAASFKNKKVVQLLLLRGADINLSDNEGRTVLMRSPDIIPFINLSSVELNKTDNSGYTLLHWAAMWNNTNLIQMLIQAGSNPNISTTSGKTPLMSASENANNEAIKVLLQLGADIQQQDSGGYTALHYSVLGHKESPKTIDLLLKNHAIINHTSNDGITALMIAANRGLAESVKLLLQKGADPNLQDSLLGTTMTHAVISKQYDIAQLLLQSGNTPQKDFSFDLWHSIIDASQNKHRYSGAILKQNMQGGIGGITMFLPIMENNLEDVNKLIAAGFDVNLTGHAGFTPLMFATIHASTPIVSTLLKAGANVNAQSEQGDTALILAATLGKKENVKELLKFHANIHIRNKKGQTALFRASSLFWHQGKWQLESLQAHIDIVNSLIEAGAEVEIYDQSNESPLLLASSLVGHHQLVARLLEAGANPNHKNNEGKNSWDYALELKEKFDDPLTLKVLIDYHNFKSKVK